MFYINRNLFKFTVLFLNIPSYIILHYNINIINLNPFKWFCDVKKKDTRFKVVDFVFATNG